MADSSAPPITNTTVTATTSANDAIAAQQEILAVSTKANTAMAWLQMALGLSSKISGR